MDWESLPLDEYQWIAQAIRYDRETMRAGLLYQKLAQLSCGLESRVKFILHHWGWTGAVRPEGDFAIEKLNRAGFTVPLPLEPFFEQLYGLYLPRKTQKDPESRGGTVRFWYQDIVDYEDWFLPSECLSVKFDDDILPIGYLLEYDGYSSNAPDGWEDPHYAAFGATCSDLFLGSSGAVYLWNLEVSDYIGVEARDMGGFLAASFGLIEDQGELGDAASDEDLERMEEIEGRVHAGIYRQNDLRSQWLRRKETLL